MKNILLISIILISIIPISVLAQKKTHFTISVEISSPKTKKYFYNTNTYEINNIDIINTENGFIFNYGLNTTYNYMIFKRLSIGALLGFNNDNKQNFSHFRIGINSKYYFVKDRFYNFNLQLAKNISLNTNKFKSGVNFKIGIDFPVFKLNERIFTFGLFWEQNYYKLDNCNKLLNMSDEIPRSLTNHLLGLNIGVSL